MATTECSCKLCHSQGIYAVTSIQLESLTLAIFLSAEFGFFGVAVVTFVQIHFLNGAQSLLKILFHFIELKENCKAGDLLFFTVFFLGFLIS
jgi:hypothetical protein